MTNTSEPSSKKFSIPVLLMIGAILFAFVQTFSLLSPIYLSFLLTLLISLALNPLVNKLRALTGGRKGATVLVVFAIISVFALSGWAFFNPLRDSVNNLSEVLPGYWERLQKPLIKMEQHAKLAEVKLQAEVTTEIATATEANAAADEVLPTELEPSSTPKGTNTIRSNLAQMLRGVVGSFTRVAFNGVQVLVVLVTVFFGVIFMLMNPRPILAAIFSLVPERQHPQAVIIMHRICRFAPAWGGSTLAGMVTIGVLVFFLMWPLLGLMDALVLGLIAGLLESVPFLGPTLSTVPAILLAIGKGGLTPLWVLLAYIGVQALENNVILPIIMARGMKLHAVAVIFSMLLCVAAFGVLGVLVAAPLVAIVSILHEELYRKKLLPTVNDADLDGLARKVLHEKSLDSD
ncbi:MAG: AI-2E family transporter [Pirellulaceae bacterium]|nr:AI-2E family transporter [Pirellulaceae bacterium]